MVNQQGNSQVKEVALYSWDAKQGAVHKMVKEIVPGSVVCDGCGQEMSDFDIECGCSENLLAHEGENGQTKDYRFCNQCMEQTPCDPGEWFTLPIVKQKIRQCNWYCQVCNKEIHHSHILTVITNKQNDKDWICLDCLRAKYDVRAYLK
jgi:hypothetical protein